MNQLRTPIAVNTRLCFNLALIISAAILIFGCSNSSLNRINGKWTASGDTGDTADFHSWYLEYQFEGRNFVKTGYPPVREEGNMDIIEEKGDSIKVYFNVQKSDPKQRSYEEWLILKDSMLSIGGVQLHKSIPSAN